MLHKQWRLIHQSRSKIHKVQLMVAYDYSSLTTDPLSVIKTDTINTKCDSWLPNVNYGWPKVTTFTICDLCLANVDLIYRVLATIHHRDKTQQVRLTGVAKTEVEMGTPSLTKML